MLARFPRIRLFSAPTPLERLDRLTRLMGGPEIWIKRDDYTAFAMGGNKIRKLEWLFGAALAMGANHVVTHGAVQSNHVRQAAAVARKLGMTCTALLEQRVVTDDNDYLSSGNVLLDRLFQCRIEYRPSGLDMNAEVERKAGELRAAGEIAYAIPGGGSNPIGALGYVSCAQELMEQADTLALRIDRIVTATGSAGTHAGLLVGLEAMHAAVPVLGIGVRLPRERQEENVYRLAETTAEYVGRGTGVPRGAVVANCDYVGEGYGIPTSGVAEAIRLLAQEEGILLDPVYTGKAMAGLLDLIRRGFFAKGETVVFLHTGGASALFGYRTFLENEVCGPD